MCSTDIGHYHRETDASDIGTNTARAEPCMKKEGRNGHTHSMANSRGTAVWALPDARPWRYWACVELRVNVFDFDRGLIDQDATASASPPAS